MRIAIDGRFLTDRYPGIGRYLFHLLPALSRLAYPERIHVLVDSASPNSRFDLDHLRRQGLELTTTEVPARQPGEQLVLPRWLRRIGAEVFHVPFWWTARFLPCPLVLTLHDSIPLEVPTTLSPLRRSLYRTAARTSARRARRLLTLSRSARAQIETHLSIPRQRIDVTPLAAGPHYRPAPPDVVGELRRRLDLPALYVLTFAGRRPHKNLDHLLLAWQGLAIPAGTPILVLAGLDQPASHPNAALPGGVRRLGPLTERDLPILLSGARLLAVPSLAEGFGLPVLEAMACATPVACSAIPVFREVAADAALYFDPLEPASIASALGQLLQDDGLRESLVHAGLRRARTFSWEETARRTFDAYRQALAP